MYISTYAFRGTHSTSLVNLFPSGIDFRRIWYKIYSWRAPSASQHQISVTALHRSASSHPYRSISFLLIFLFFWHHYQHDNLPFLLLLVTVTFRWLLLQRSNGLLIQILLPLPVVACRCFQSFIILSDINIKTISRLSNSSMYFQTAPTVSYFKRYYLLSRFVISHFIDRCAHNFNFF